VAGALFAWLISHQPAVLFSHNKPATSNQPAVLFSQNKSAPAISHQPNKQAAEARARHREAEGLGSPSPDPDAGKAWVRSWAGHTSAKGGRCQGVGGGRGQGVRGSRQRLHREAAAIDDDDALRSCGWRQEQSGRFRERRQTIKGGSRIGGGAPPE
jgi:hypothetical protein